MLLTKLRNRVLREALRFPPVRQRSDDAYKAALADHRALLSALSPLRARLAAEMEENGVVVTSLRELAGAGADSPTILAAAQEVAKTSLTAPVNKIGFVAHAPTHEMVRVPEIYRWGLEDPLDLVEHALGLPVAYHGVYLRRDIANTVVSNSRLWHRDTEDRRIVKIIVYLNDVDKDSGAFQYLPLSLSSRLTAAFGGRYGFYTDEQVRQVSTPNTLDALQTCAGVAGTVIVADASRTYHRGSRPVTQDRLALFYDYTSRRPLHPFYCKPAFTAEQEEVLTQGMTERQRSCVLWRPASARPPADVF